MMPRKMQIRALVLAASLGLLSLLPPPTASALLLDARRMAMGGVSRPEAGQLASDNLAYWIAPSRSVEWEGSFPVPLGLLTLFDHPQELNPDNDDFDPVRLANLILNPPIHLELRPPSDLNSEIVLDLGQEHLRVYWADAHLLLPQEPLDLGGRLERFALGYGRPLGERGRWRMQVSPYLDGRAETCLDDAFYGLLAEGDSLKPDSRYSLGGEAFGAAGLAFKLKLARSYGEETDTQVFLGLGPKLLLGLGMAVADTDLTLSSGDSLFASEDLEVRQVSHTRVSQSAGAGFALDLGVLMRRGSLDFGLGVRDLGGSIHFGRTRLERQTLEEADDGNESDVVTEILAEGDSYTYDLDPYWTFNAGWHAGPLMLLGELRLRPWRESLHLGGEYRYGEWALRGGLHRDGGASWQFGAGAGRRLGGVHLDLAIETHDRYIQDERGVALGLSIIL